MKFLDKNFYIIIIFILIIICISIYFFTKDNSEDIISSSNFYIQSDTISSTEKITDIVVHIDGEILNPGIVHLSSETRISDAIEAAGGTTDVADISKVNLAYVLQDGQKIYIPSIYDEEIVVYVTTDAGENVLVPDSQSDKTLININSANLTELQNLSGIGASTAQKIINYRETSGKFKCIEDIMNVPGIGEAKFNAIKDFICI